MRGRNWDAKGQLVHERICKVLMRMRRVWVKVRTVENQGGQ